MYVNTLSISSRGQIVLPKEVRDTLKTNIISLKINEHGQVLISPVRDLGGALAAYQKETPPRLEAIREQVCEEHISVVNPQQETA